MYENVALQFKSNERYVAVWHFVNKFNIFGQIISNVQVHKAQDLQLYVYSYTSICFFHTELIMFVNPNYIKPASTAYGDAQINISFDCPIRNIISLSNHGAGRRDLIAVCLWCNQTWQLQ